MPSSWLPTIYFYDPDTPYPQWHFCMDEADALMNLDNETIVRNIIGEMKGEHQVPACSLQPRPALPGMGFKARDDKVRPVRNTTGRKPKLCAHRRRRSGLVGPGGLKEGLHTRLCRPAILQKRRRRRLSQCWSTLCS